MARRKPSWTPAASFTVIRLPSNGPKPNQSTSAWLYGKTKADQHLMDNPKTQFNDLR